MRDAEVRVRVEQLEPLLAAIEHDAAAMAAVQGLVELYGEALRRIVEHGGVDADDELVGHLLLVHDLHPLEVEERVARALEEVRPYLGSHGGNVELVAVEDGVARLRLEGTCDGCASATVTLRASIEAAVLRAAPELTGVEAVGGVREPELLQIRRVRAPGPCLPDPVA